MIASVYLKGNNIHFYNEERSLTNVGGVAYELGRPLLDFVWYEQERFEEAFSMMAEAYDNEYAHIGAKKPDFISETKRMMSELQQREVYICFYHKIFMDFIYAFIDSPRQAVEKLSEKLPNDSKYSYQLRSYLSKEETLKIAGSIELQDTEK